MPTRRADALSPHRPPAWPGWGRLLGARSVALAGLLMLVWGCQAPQRRESAGPLSPADHAYEPDIPLPEGFALQEQSSEDFLAGSVRYLRHRYAGPADKYAVRRFYRRQMPLVRWTPLSDSQVQGRYTMRFERSGESCTVRIEDKPGRARGQVLVEVVITPAPGTVSPGTPPRP